MDEKIKKLWAYIGNNSGAFLNHFPDHIAAITKLLVLCIISDGELSTGVAILGEKTWALVTMNEYDGDNELSIRYHGGKHYDLHFSYYNNEKEDFISVTHIYTTEEIQYLPQGLCQLLQRSFDTGEPQTVNSNTLDRH